MHTTHWSNTATQNTNNNNLGYLILQILLFISTTMLCTLCSLQWLAQTNPNPTTATLYYFGLLPVVHPRLNTAAGELSLPPRHIITHITIPTIIITVDTRSRSPHKEKYHQSCQDSTYIHHMPINLENNTNLSTPAPIPHQQTINKSQRFDPHENPTYHPRCCHKTQLHYYPKHVPPPKPIPEVAPCPRHTTHTQSHLTHKGHLRAITNHVTKNNTYTSSFPTDLDIIPHALHYDTPKLNLYLSNKVKPQPTHNSTHYDCLSQTTQPNLKTQPQHKLHSIPIQWPRPTNLATHITIHTTS